MKTWIRLMALGCALLPCLAPAWAGIGAGDWEVGFDLGGAKLDSALTDRGAFHFALRGGYFATDLLQIEGQVSSASTEADPTGHDVTTLFLDLVVNFRSNSSIVPYFLVGVGETTVGMTDDSGRYRIIVEDDATGFQAAVGSRFFVRRDGKLAIRLELGGQTENAFDERKTHGRLAVGLTWRLGKRR